MGHLQRNKVKKAVKLFDMIETIDSVEIADAVNRRCAFVDKLIMQIHDLPNLRIQGLMTMGPRFGNPEDARPYFKATRSAFDRLSKARIPNVEMCHPSMGMSNSYNIVIEEGANMIRVGTKLFGEQV